MKANTCGLTVRSKAADGLENVTCGVVVLVPTKPANRDETCPICTVPYSSSPDAVVRTTCPVLPGSAPNQFHLACIKRYRNATQDNLCPVSGYPICEECEFSESRDGHGDGDGAY